MAHPRVGRIPGRRPHRGHTWHHRLGIALGRDAGCRGLLGLRCGGNSPAVGHGRGAGRHRLGIALERDAGHRGLLGLHRGGGQSRRRPREARWAALPGDSLGAGRWPPGPAGAAGTGWADSHSAWNQPPLREILLGLTEAGTASGRSRRGPPKRCPQGAKPGRRGFRRRALSAPCRTGTAPAAAGRWGARRLSPARAGP